MIENYKYNEHFVQWCTISEAPNYAVSDRGCVKNKKTGRILASTWSSSGYRKVTVRTTNKESYKEYVHRLVAKAFIPNPDNLPQVDHKYEDKENNCARDLRWCTSKENINWYWNDKEHKTQKYIKETAEHREVRLKEFSQVQRQMAKDKKIGIPVKVNNTEYFSVGDATRYIFNNHTEGTAKEATIRKEVQKVAKGKSEARMMYSKYFIEKA